ncbi:hypothetical protein [uncultured Mameliella sp.]|uniref:hypothetical protein n=1 Tax=uncultured Mameliella sp. TaxID=1447087 RepID=UPI002607285E|nr:hypothetical protein [uncultured Mameliella sp.]
MDHAPFSAKGRHLVPLVELVEKIWDRTPLATLERGGSGTWLPDGTPLPGAAPD